ncbi:MAG: iron-containing alcohol dehydrogenase [Acidobacteriaceae bacterium]|nr:iron-containing alcohol dehydrogenase [Acidobacteriaceae bacterium]
MTFEFATAARIVFGQGAIAELPQIAREWGRRALVVTGRNAERAEAVRRELRGLGIECREFSVHGEPTVEMVRRGTEAARAGCDVVIGFGGGSAMDAAKAIAALAKNAGDVLDYMEGVGRGWVLERAGLPFLAVPTTAGTGAEVTKNAVIGSPEHGVKASVRSASMLAKVAVIDPELTRDAPREVTAASGLDALTQLVEAYVSPRANAMTDLFCVEGLKLAANSLDRVYRDGHDMDAREAMSLAALLSGLALANAGLGAVHGFAGPLGGMLDAPHGALCAAVLPHATAVNIRALRDREPDGEGLRRYGEVGRILTGREDARAEDAAEWMAETCRGMAISNLRRHGLDQGQIPELVEKASRANSMKANAVKLTEGELREVAERTL